MVEIKKDVSLAKEHFGDKPKRVFLMDANSIVLKTEMLIEICDLLYLTFPNLERISCYGSARFIIKKELKELDLLRQAGLKKIYMGLETGDDSLLSYMNKGIASSDLISAAKMIKDAEIELSVTIIVGLGGEGSWPKNAKATAQILNKMKPDELRIHNLILKHNSPLYERVKKEEFKEAAWQEVIKEMRELIKRLNINTTVYTHPTTHINPVLLYERKLPEEKESMLEILDSALKSPEKYLQKERSFQYY
jgi:radical SAM superfamily enzyme YgiQ (UPF0313 family)